jgi:hypothetical protein
MREWPLVCSTPASMLTWLDPALQAIPDKLGTHSMMAV